MTARLHPLPKPLFQKAGGIVRTVQIEISTVAILTSDLPHDDPHVQVRTHLSSRFFDFVNLYNQGFNPWALVDADSDYAQRIASWLLRDGYVTADIKKDDIIIDLKPNNKGTILKE